MMKTLYFAIYKFLDYAKSGLIIVELIAVALNLYIFLDVQKLKANEFLFITNLFLFLLSIYTTLMQLNRMKTEERDMFISKPLGKTGFFLGNSLASFFIIFSSFLLMLIYAILVKKIETNIFLILSILISILNFSFSILLTTLLSNVLIGKRFVWLLFPVYVFIIVFDFYVFEENLNIEIFGILKYLTPPIHHFLRAFSDGYFKSNTIYYVFFELLLSALFIFLIYRISKRKDFE